LQAITMLHWSLLEAWGRVPVAWANVGERQLSAVADFIPNDLG